MFVFSGIANRSSRFSDWLAETQKVCRIDGIAAVIRTRQVSFSAAQAVAIAARTASGASCALMDRCIPQYFSSGVSQSLRDIMAYREDLRALEEEAVTELYAKLEVAEKRNPEETTPTRGRRESPRRLTGGGRLSQGDTLRLRDTAKAAWLARSDEATQEKFRQFDFSDLRPPTTVSDAEIVSFVEDCVDSFGSLHRLAINGQLRHLPPAAGRAAARWLCAQPLFRNVVLEVVTRGLRVKHSCYIFLRAQATELLHDYSRRGVCKDQAISLAPLKDISAAAAVPHGFEIEARFGQAIRPIRLDG